MSIWGSRPTQNDDAADWLGEFLEAPTVGRVRAALRLNKGYIDVDRGAEVIVAAEVIAQLGGHPRQPSAELTKTQLGLLVPCFSKVAAAEWKMLTRMAIDSIGRVADAEQSELRQLIGERKAWLTRWTALLSDLSKRLSLPVRKLKTVAVGKPPVKQRPIKVPLGAIIAIPLGAKQFAFAKVYRDGAYGVYDFVSPRIVPIEAIQVHAFAFFTVGTDLAIKRGTWPIIGHEPFPNDDGAWAPAMATGMEVAFISNGDYSAFKRDQPVQAAMMYQGEFRNCTLDEVIGLDIWELAHKPELLVEIIVDRLVRGHHARHRVMPLST